MKLKAIVFLCIVWFEGFSQSREIKHELSISNQFGFSFKETTDWVKTAPIYLKPGLGYNIVLPISEKIQLVSGLDYRIGRPMISYKILTSNADFGNKLPYEEKGYRNTYFSDWSLGSIELPLNLRYRFKGSNFLEFGFSLNRSLIKSYAGRILFSNFDLPPNEETMVFIVSNEYNYRPKSNIGILLILKYRYEFQNPKFQRVFFTVGTRYQIYNNPTLILNYFTPDEKLVHQEFVQSARFSIATGLGIKLGKTQTK